MWDLPEDLKEHELPALTLPLMLKRSQYDSQELYEEDVFKRLEELGGFPVVAFVEDVKWNDLNMGNPHGVKESHADQQDRSKKKKKLSRKQKKKAQKAAKKNNR